MENCESLCLAMQPVAKSAIPSEAERSIKGEPEMRREQHEWLAIVLLCKGSRNCSDPAERQQMFRGRSTTSVVVDRPPVLWPNATPNISDCFFECRYAFSLTDIRFMKALAISHNSNRNSDVDLLASQRNPRWKGLALQWLFIDFYIAHT